MYTYRCDTQRRLRPACLILGAFIMVVSAALNVSCSRSSTATPSPFTVEEAFRAAHPGGALPAGLKTVGGASLAYEQLESAVGLDRILVPRWLPPGYGLAAPYIAVGSGTALPNPQLWAGGYRVTYTDGDGLIVLHVGAGRLPGDGPWLPLTRSWQGVRLWGRAANGLVTVGALGAKDPVAVAVAGLPADVADRVLVCLREAP